MTIRAARDDDLPRILAITNHAIAETTALWSITPETIEARRAWLAARRSRDFPVLVAERDGGVVGFGSFAGFRAEAAGATAVEHSVYVDAGHLRRGIGKALLVALIAGARRRGVHVMIGGIDADNTASLKLHAGLGFEEAVRLKRVGRKFDRWLDLVFMQKIL